MGNLRGRCFISTIVAIVMLCGYAWGAESKPVTPTEDLLREHAVIGRLLLIFREDSRRLRANEATPAQPLLQSCDIIRSFVQNYHEKNEENYIFSALEKKNKLVDTTKVLRVQHDAGRKLIDSIRGVLRNYNFQDSSARNSLADLLDSFVSMYEPHKAREGSVVFPAFYDQTPKLELDKLGEKFEGNEHKLFGENGFERIVNKVAGIEKELGIYDLSQFTPSIDSTR